MVCWQPPSRCKTGARGEAGRPRKEENILSSATFSRSGGNVWAQSGQEFLWWPLKPEHKLRPTPSLLILLFSFHTYCCLQWVRPCAWLQIKDRSWECKLVQPLWKRVWRSLTKLKIELPYDPAISLLGIYPDKIIIQKDTCTTPMFIAVLFPTAKTWKQPKCPLTDEWIKKICYVHICVYIYMCVCVCVCVHIHTHTHTHNGILLSHKKE